MRRLLLLIAGLLILLAVAVPTAAFYYLAFTESGLRFIVSLVPHRVAGVQLDIVNASGTVARGIHVERMEIDHHLVHLRFEGIEGRVALTPLLWQTIRSRDAFIRSAYVQLRRRTIPATPSTPIFLPRWLIVSAERARVGNAVLILQNGRRLEASQLLASGVARHRTIRFFEAQMQMADVRVSGSGELRAADPLRLDIDGRITWTPDKQPAWTIASSAKGDLNSLALTAHVLTPFRSDFTGHALDLTGQWHWLGDAVVHDFDIRAWGGGPVLGIISGRLAVQGNADGFAAHGPLTPAGLRAGVFETEFEGAYADRVLTAKRIDVKHPGSGAHATGAGTVGIVKDGPRLDLHGTWREFRWPLVGADVAVRSASGEYTLDGTWPYTVRANGVFTTRDLPPMPAKVEGSLAKDKFTYTSADVDAFDGHASLNGEVTWAPSQSWSVSGQATGLDPSRIRADLPGKLSFALAARGQSFSGNGDFTFELHDLSGRLRGVPASGAGKLARNALAWQFDSVRVGLGRTRLALDGRVDDQIDLRFALTAEDLSLLAADSRGQLQAAGTIRGTWSEPIIATTAHGGGIHHDGVTVGSFDAAIDFDPHSQRESKVDAHVHHLTYQARTLENLDFTLGGTPTNYAVHLDAKAVGLAVTAQATGPFAHGIWQAQLSGLTINGNDALHLGLERPVRLVVSADRVRAEWMCVVGKPASMCADGEWTPAKWSATLTANELPLNTLTSGLTRSVEYGGKINVLARVFGAGQDPPQGTVRIDLMNAWLAHRLLSGRTERTTLGSGLVTLNATRSDLNADVGLEAGQIGTLKGTLDAQRGAHQWQNMPIQGELHAHTGDLGLIELYMPDIDRAAGQLDADVKFAGTLGTPLVNGVVKLSDAEIDLYQVNLGLRQVGLVARLTDNGLDFGGSARVGQGTATARGRLEWRNSLPYGKFQLEGANLRVVDIPEAQIDASPSLDFSIDGRKIEVTGTVKVPNARIVPKDLTGAVRASSDEVILGEDSTDPAKRFEVVSAITLTLGDQVNIDTTGLTGRLAGNITVRSGYDELTRAAGELSVEEGKYRAYARRLDIQRGRLIFTGGPIQNPGVDIRAVKRFPDVVAGVNVRGTLLQPRMNFFSEPSLPQSQIVSLILAGGSLETAQSRQTGAGNELLAQGGAILAQQVGALIGVQDVSLESDLTNATSLVLGKYLSPRLYVSYGVSLTQQLNTLKLRYSLGDHWTVKTEVGQARGGDLVYSIEK